MNRVQLLAGDRTGHMMSSCVTTSQITKILTSIIPHRIELESWGDVSLHLSCYDASSDMQYVLYELPGSFIKSGHLTSPGVKFSN